MNSTIQKDKIKVVQPCSECKRTEISSRFVVGGWEMKCGCGHSVTVYGDDAADKCLIEWNGTRPSSKPDNPHSALIGQIDALLRLDASNALVPHGIGGHARELLTKARAALHPTPAHSGEREALERRPAAFEVLDLENGTYLTRSEEAAIRSGYGYNGLYRRAAMEAKT